MFHGRLLPKIEMVCKETYLKDLWNGSYSQKLSPHVDSLVAPTHGPRWTVRSASLGKDVVVLKVGQVTAQEACIWPNQNFHLAEIYFTKWNRNNVTIPILNKPSNWCHHRIFSPMVEGLFKIGIVMLFLFHFVKYIWVYFCKYTFLFIIMSNVKRLKN